MPKSNRVRKRPVQMLVAQRIRQFRNEREWSIRDLENKLAEIDSDLDYHAIRRIENGERVISIDEALELCKAFKVSWPELLEDNETKAYQAARRALRDVEKEEMHLGDLLDESTRFDDVLHDIRQRTNQTYRNVQELQERARKLLDKLPADQAAQLIEQFGWLTDEQRKSADQKLLTIADKKFANGSLSNIEARMFAEKYPDKYDVTTVVTQLSTGERREF